MSEEVSNVTTKLYQQHAQEASVVESTENRIYQLHEKLASMYSTPSDVVIAKTYDVFEDARRVEPLYKELEVAHRALVFGIARNRQHFAEHEASYMQEAVEDATNQGIDLAGWSTVNL